MAKLDLFKRYQPDLNLIDLFPSIPNYCACGCGTKLTGKKFRWASSDCSDKAYKIFAIIKGNNNAVRNALWDIDYGHCRHCGTFDYKWQADHIIPVEKGGGACDIANYQTLCPSCHQEKTNYQRVGHLAAISSQEAVNESNDRLYAFGATP